MSDDWRYHGKPAPTNQTSSTTVSGHICPTCGQLHGPVTASDARPEYEPFMVEPDWTRADIIGNLGPTYRLLTYADGTVRFEHRCDRGQRGVIICAPALQIGTGHTITRNGDGEPTVTPSILCSDCGTHGFVIDGRWADA